MIGGSGDWFDVQDTTIMMDNYNCLDVSKKARSICKTFCTGRVQFNGRGLVHQLPWPLADDPALVDSENSAFKGIVKARRCRYMSRMLCNITLPSNFNKGGSVTASEDGHSVTFCSTYSERTGYINDDIMKKRKIVSGSGDVANFGDDPSALGTGGLLVEPNCAERSITMDISKLEQRISTKEGALGIAFAIIFVESILDRSTQQLRSHVGGNIGNSYSTSQNAIHVKLTELTETRNDETEEAEREETMLCTASVACDDSVVADSRLQTLLQRFDNLRGSWNVRRREVNQPVDVAASSHEMQDIGNSADKLIDSERRQRIIDLETAHKIHREFLCRQDFTWPRKYEVAASINRLRGSYFTRKIFVG